MICARPPSPNHELIKASVVMWTWSQLNLIWQRSLIDRSTSKRAYGAKRHVLVKRIRSSSGVCRVQSNLVTEWMTYQWRRCCLGDNNKNRDKAVCCIIQSLLDLLCHVPVCTLRDFMRALSDNKCTRRSQRAAVLYRPSSLRAKREMIS